MAGAQSAIVTGANSGLGLECCRSLLAGSGDWHVVLAVRDQARGADAVAALGHPERCTVMRLDLASLESVRAFVSAYQSDGTLPPTRAIVCNAGLQVISGTRYTSDGIEMTFGTNHLGHFALVTGLLDRLSPPARIVVVSSDTHDPSKAVGMPAPVYRSAEELAHPSATDRSESEVKAGRRRYTTSKLCNLLFAYELDRRLEHGEKDVTVNAFNPGLMPGSGLARDYGPVQRLAWRFVMPALRVLPQVRSTRQSGAALAALASSSEFDGVTGKYFDGRRPISSSADSYDQVRAQDLWEWSARQIPNFGGTDSSLS
jgi:NAD(P)-dependent dehydrogenase (short-subunit alcohol dehydrogenase family)